MASHSVVLLTMPCGFLVGVVMMLDSTFYAVAVLFAFIATHGAALAAGSSSLTFNDPSTVWSLLTSLVTVASILANVIAPSSAIGRLISLAALNIRSGPSKAP